MYCACFLYLLSLCVVCYYTAYTLSFLLFSTVLCLVSFTCIIVVFFLLFLCASVFTFVYGLSTVEWSVALTTCVFTVCCVSLRTSPGVYFVNASLYFLYIRLFYFYISFSTFYINRNLFLNLG